MHYIGHYIGNRLYRILPLLVVPTCANQLRRHYSGQPALLLNRRHGARYPLSMFAFPCPKKPLYRTFGQGVKSRSPTPSNRTYKVISFPCRKKPHIVFSEASSAVADGLLVRHGHSVQHPLPKVREVWSEELRVLAGSRLQDIDEKK